MLWAAPVAAEGPWRAYLGSPASLFFLGKASTWRGGAVLLWPAALINLRPLLCPLGSRIEMLASLRQTGAAGAAGRGGAAVSALLRGGIGADKLLGAAGWSALPARPYSPEVNSCWYPSG